MRLLLRSSGREQQRRKAAGRRKGGGPATPAWLWRPRFRLARRDPRRLGRVYTLPIDLGQALAWPDGVRGALFWALDGVRHGRVACRSSQRMQQRIAIAEPEADRRRAIASSRLAPRFRGADTRQRSTKRRARTRPNRCAFVQGRWIDKLRIFFNPPVPPAARAFRAGDRSSIQEIDLSLFVRVTCRQRQTVASSQTMHQSEHPSHVGTLQPSQLLSNSSSRPWNPQAAGSNSTSEGSTWRRGGSV